MMMTRLTMVMMMKMTMLTMMLMMRMAMLMKNLVVLGLAADGVLVVLPKLEFLS